MTVFLKSVIGGVFLAASLTGCGGGSGGGSGALVTTESAAPTTPGSGPSAGSSSDSSGTSSPTLAQQIEALERKGDYPSLDRSSDIAGPDNNKNGVRDDIESWINTLIVTELQRRALMQKAKTLQQTLLVDFNDKDAVQRVGEGLMASNKCGASRFMPYDEFSVLRGKIEAMTANTRARAARYMQFNKASSGSSTTYPSDNTCEP